MMIPDGRLMAPKAGDRFDEFGLIWIVDKVRKAGREIHVHRESRDAFGKLSKFGHRVFDIREFGHMRRVGPDPYLSRDPRKRTPRA